MSFSWWCYEFVINLVDVIALYIFLNIFLKKKSANLFRSIGVIVLFAIIIQALNMILGVTSFLTILNLIFLSIILFNNFFFDKTAKIALITLCFIVVMIIFELIGSLFVTVIFKIPVHFIAHPTSYRVFTAIIVRLALLIFLYLLRKLKISHSHIKKIYIYQLIVILLINIFFAYLIFNIYTKNNIFTKENVLIMICLSLSMVIFSIFILKITDSIIKYSAKEIQWTMREREYQGQIKYINSMQEFNYKLKAQRHDFNHHIGCIYGLLESNKVEYTKEYISKLVENIQKVNTIVNVENGVIAALLNHKLSVAKEKNIEINTDINIPKKLNIDPIDISIVLGNAIDNAIEASEKASKKMIDIKIFIQKEYLIIKIANTKGGNCIKEEDRYKTTKEDKENHGFGIQNIKYIVEKYDGLLKIEESELFVINIAL